MTKATDYKPSGTHTITPHLVIKNLAKAIEFYKKAFGAEELYRMPTPDGRLMHACMQFGDSRVFFADEFPEHKRHYGSPETIGGKHMTMHMYVPNTDEAFKRAIEAGAKEEMPPADMFWGDRYARVIDPFGQPWSLAMHQEDLTPEEMQKRSAEYMKQPAAAK
jgi:uncharacterized glyoxalase superfamily protein PhnB